MGLSLQGCGGISWKSSGKEADARSSCFHYTQQHNFLADTIIYLDRMFIPLCAIVLFDNLNCFFVNISAQ